MSAELFRTIDLDPKPDSFPAETPGTWLEQRLLIKTLADLGIDNASHPAIHDLAFMLNSSTTEMNKRVSVQKLWDILGGEQQTVIGARQKIAELL